MTGPPTQLPPSNPVKQAVDVADGYLYVRSLGNLLLDLPGGGGITSLSTLLEALQQVCFLGKRQISPVAPTPTSPLQSIWSQAVVLAHPKPNRLLRNHQQAGDTMGGKGTGESHPDGYTLPVFLAAMGFPDPSL